MAQKSVPRKPASNTLQISRKQLWAFRIAAIIVIPIIFLTVLEIILCLIGFGYNTHAMIERKINGREVCCNNMKFCWRFFPNNIARDLHPFVFEKKKPQGTYRIFVMGASATLGVPGPEYNFARILEVMLSDKYPETKFEVITVAAVAINSHVVLQMAEDCARYEPDLFVLYLGNNEVVGPYGPGTVLTHLPMNLPMIRANIAMKSTRTGQIYDKFFSATTGNKKNSTARWDGMELFLDKQVRYNSDDLESVYLYYKKNLENICKVAKRAGADTIISNVGSNLKDCPPFASMHKETLGEDEKRKWQQVYQQGIEYETAGEYKQAITSYQKAAAIDETFADLQFRLGRCFMETGQYETAKEYYIKARDYDTLRFRADTRINEIIEKSADEQKDIYFVDSVSALEENSPHGITGEEFFYEHVHLNFSGNYVIAKAIFEQTSKILTLTLNEKDGPTLNEQQCADTLAYTDFDRYYLLNFMLTSMLDKPPFSNQLYHNEFIDKTRDEVKQLDVYAQPAKLKASLDKYKKVIQERPDDWQLLWRYGLILSNKSIDLKAAETQLRRSLEICPYNPIVYSALGHVLYKQGNIIETRKTLLRLLEIRPNSPQAHNELANLYKLNNDYKNYILHTTESLAIESVSSIDSHVDLADAYYRIGNTDKAIEVLVQAIKSFPENKTAKGHGYLSMMLSRRGQYREALDEAKFALSIDPNQVNEKGFKDYLNKLKQKVGP